MPFGFAGDLDIESYSALAALGLAQPSDLPANGIREQDPMERSRSLRRSRLERIVASYPIVGQSIDLDAEQLKRAGEPCAERSLIHLSWQVCCSPA